MNRNSILKYLKGTSEYVSGEDLSKKLGISRSAIWKNINLLREKGYTIESVTNRGYKLISCPDLLSEEEIGSYLQTQFIGKKIYYFETIDSTNEEAKRQAANGAPNGSMILSETQTGGKGRLGRKWSSSPGDGIYFSLLLRPNDSPSEISNITLLSGLAVCNGIREYTGCNAQIKWPNDVVIDGKKTCGILTEMSAEVDQIHFLIIGIGINVNQDKFGEDIAFKATSLFLENGQKLHRSELLAEILKQFEALYRLYQNHETQKLLSLYKNNCVTLSRKVSTIRNGKTLLGTAIDILPSGELLVLGEDGKTFSINSGEVSVQGVYGENIAL